MTETDYIKERFSMWFRLMLATFAALIVIFGATLRLILAEFRSTVVGIEVAVPVEMIGLIVAGGAISIVAVVLFFWFMKLAAQCMRRMKLLMETSHV